MSEADKKRKGHVDMQFVTATMSTTLVLILLGLVVFFVTSAHSLSVYVRENIVFSILLSDDMSDREVVRLQDRLNAAPFVKKLEYISKKQALQEHTEAMGTDPQEFLGYNPFSASIEIRLKSEYANPDSIAKIEHFVGQESNIQELLYQKELLNLVNDNIRSATFVLFVLAVILTLISFALISNTIRLTIYSKRFLIHTMKLVGASWGFIRRPFIVRNVWVGLLSALLAGLALMGGASWLVSYEPELVRFVTPQTMALVAFCVLVCGVLITTCCAYFSINRYLRMSTGTLYNS